MQKPSATIVTGAIAVVAAFSIFAVLQWRASTATEIDSIKRVSRVELERAFPQLRIVINDQRDAFWRVRVVQNLDPGRRRLPRSGEAYAATRFLAPCSCTTT